MGFTAHFPGNYLLTFTGMESFPSGTVILLEDVKDNVLVDCRDNPDYGFAYSAGDDPERFLIHFTITSGLDERTSHRLILFNSGNQLNLLIPASFNSGVVFIYDMTGRMIHRERAGGTGLMTVTLPEAHGWNIIQVVSPAGVISQKIFIP
jgi:hypothetical protein